MLCGWLLWFLPGATVMQKCYNGVSCRGELRGRTGTHAGGFWFDRRVYWARHGSSFLTPLFRHLVPFKAVLTVAVVSIRMWRKVKGQSVSVDIYTAALNTFFMGLETFTTSQWSSIWTKVCFELACRHWVASNCVCQMVSFQTHCHLGCQVKSWLQTLNLLRIHLGLMRTSRLNHMTITH